MAQHGWQAQACSVQELGHPGTLQPTGGPASCLQCQRDYGSESIWPSPDGQPLSRDGLSFLGYTPGSRSPGGLDLETPRPPGLGARAGQALLCPQTLAFHPPPLPPHAGGPRRNGAVTVSIPADSRSRCAAEQHAAVHLGSCCPWPSPRPRKRPQPSPEPQPLPFHTGATNPHRPWPSTSRSSTTSQPATRTSCRCSRTRSWR